MWAFRSPGTKSAVPTPVLFCIPLTYSQARRPALLSAAAHAALWESGPWRGPAHSRAVMDVKRHPPDPATLSHGCLSFALALPLENKPVGFFLVLGLQMSVKQRCGQKTNFESRGGFSDPELQRKAGKRAQISRGVTIGVLEKERDTEASRTWEGPASAAGGSAGRPELPLLVLAAPGKEGMQFPLQHISLLLPARPPPPPPHTPPSCLSFPICSLMGCL